MGAQSIELPAKYFNPVIWAESAEEIAEATIVYPGNIHYNPFAGRDNLPGIRGMGTYGGSMPYPTFHQDYGDIFVLKQRFEGEDITMPRLSVGTVATIRGCTVVNIPVGRSFPNSKYEQRVVKSRETTELAIGFAVLDFINGKEGEVKTSFPALLVKQAAEAGRARRALHKEITWNNKYSFMRRKS